MSAQTGNGGVVLDVLSRAAGVSTRARPENEDGWQKILLMSQDSTVLETVILPRIVPRRMLFRLTHKYDVAIHFFYHPEMIPGPDEGVH